MRKMAKKLAAYNHVSRVSVSIDSMDEKTHDEIRGRKESWRESNRSPETCYKNAGMDPYLNITVGHYNAFDPSILKMLVKIFKGSIIIKLCLMLLFLQECGLKCHEIML